MVDVFHSPIGPHKDNKLHITHTHLYPRYQGWNSLFVILIFHACAFESKAYGAGRVAPWIFEITHVVKAEAIMSMHDDGFFLSCEELDDNGIERNVPKVPCLSAACSEPPGSLLH